MAVTYPSQTAHTNTTGSPGGSPFAGSYTPPSGSNRLAIFLVAWGATSGAGASSAISWGGQSATQIGTTVTDSNWVSHNVYRFTETQIAAKSDDNYSITHTGGNQLGIIAFVLAGVDQNTPTSSVQAGSGSGTTAQASAAVSSALDGMVIALLMTDDQAINTSTAHSGTNITYTAVIASDTIAGAQRTAGTGGSINLTWTQVSNGYAVKAFNVNPDVTVSATVSKIDNQLLRPFNTGISSGQFRRMF